MSRPRCSVPRRHLALGVALLGCSLAAASRADAAIVDLDINALGLGGPNAGLAVNSYKDVTINGTAVIRVSRQLGGSWSSYTGFIGTGSFEVAWTSGYANPRSFAACEMIDSSAYFIASAYDISFTDPYSGSVRANLGPGSFIGFVISFDGWATVNYGWFEVTWDGPTRTFEILAGAYESTSGQAICAGATGGGGGGVPLPGAAGLAACGLLGLSRRRRR